jgi:hypothetical protein
MALTSVPMPGLELTATLVGVKPRIWRTLRVPVLFTLDRFHRVLQIAFGWNDSHLHEFSYGPVTFGQPSDEGPHCIDDSVVALRDLNLRDGSKLRYLYDFGDDWELRIVVKSVVQSMPFVAQCLDGARAGPIDDSGGPWGYMDKLRAVRNPVTPDDHEIVEWMPPDWDAEAFEIDEINRAFRKLR